MAETSRRRVLGLAAGALAAPAHASNLPRVRILERIELTDPGRRTLPVRAYLPGSTGRFPVILFSHGFGGDLAAFPNTARSWAEAGHVVICPTHADSVRDPDPSAPAEGRGAMRAVLLARRDPARAEEARAALLDVLERPFYLASRLADIALLADCLAAGAGLPKELHARVLPSRLGMAGHSYGAYTTQVIAGVRLASASRNPSPALRARFAACMAISGQGVGRLDIAAGSFSGVTGPLFAVTGTRDFGAANETPTWRLEPFALSPPGDKYAAVVDGFTHAQFDTLDGVPAQTLRAYQLAFWQAWLRGDRGAKARLASAAAGSRETDPVWLRTR